MHDIQQALGHSSVATTETYYAQFSPPRHERYSKFWKVETKRKHLQNGRTKRSPNWQEQSHEPTEPKRHMAEEVGFEPTVLLRVQRFSSAVDWSRNLL